MPRVAGIYSRPAGTDGVPNATISSTAYNANVADVEQDLNLPRPVVAGGTGASSADTALANLSAEKANQIVTNFDTQVWIAGSFSAASTATNGPVSGHAMSGLAFVVDSSNIIIEASDNDVTGGMPTRYVRQKKAGTWGAWVADTGAPLPCAGLLSFVSATAIAFKPFNGDRIKINGALYQIPTGGIAGVANTSVYVGGVAAQNLAASTFYYVYAFVNAGVVTADFWTTAPAISLTTGNVGTEIRSGDDTRSLIGMIRTNASSQFSDSLQNRFVRSWFNRQAQRLDFFGAFTAQRTLNTTGIVEVNIEIRSNFLVWAGETVSANLNAFGWSNSAGVINYVAIGFDGNANAGWVGVGSDVNLNYANYSSSGSYGGFSEGTWHYVTLLGSITVGTLTLGSTTLFCTLSGHIAI
jgi:hypothetical protein